MQRNLDVIAAGLPVRDVLCKIIEFFNTQTLLEITLLEHRAWTAPIEAALASPTVFRNHFPCIGVDEYSLKHAHDVGPPYGPPFTFTGHFQSLLRLAAKNNAPYRDYIFDKWPENLRDRQIQSIGMYIHVCRACGCTFRCIVIQSFGVQEGVLGNWYDECHCLKEASPPFTFTGAFCGNSCYWDFNRPGGTAARMHVRMHVAAQRVFHKAPRMSVTASKEEE